ncbi:MAG: cyclomaltodextrinase C-terminal domain-containing protein, partial [Chitinophagaceae bacterium]
ANFRKHSSALTTGHTMQYVVRDGVYVYFRYDTSQTILVVTNTGQQLFKPDWSVYQERISGYLRARNILTGEERPLADWTFPAGESSILELIP